MLPRTLPPRRDDSLEFGRTCWTMCSELAIDANERRFSCLLMLMKLHWLTGLPVCLNA
jgi:hypothetical protein